ncbi:MAG: transposase [candidate division Zixibacteria bacterium]|nr:transposase [candidate division Zixibacteria bacterium]
MPKLRHYDHLGTARFVTFSCYQRQRLLGDSIGRQAVLDELSRLRTDHGVKVLGYVVMPEHVHLVLLPPDDVKLGPLIGALKARSAHIILDWIRNGQRRQRVPVRSGGTPAVWQKRCYDHNCRTPEIVVEKVKYCHDNPVKRGLVAQPENWPWSSCRWYVGQREGIPEIDGIEL